MKITAILVVILLAVALVAQSANQFSMVTPTAAVTACPAPVANANILCSVTDGYYESVAGGGYAKISVGGGGGVVTWNGRTGNVTPALGDYTFPQLGGRLAASQLPTTFTCTATLGQNNQFTLVCP